jgi:hypothetical protein
LCGWTNNYSPTSTRPKESVKSSRLDQKGLFGVIADYVFLALGWIAFGIYFLLMIQEFAPFMGDFKPLSYVFGDSVNVIHIIFFLIVFFKGWKWYQQRSDLLALQVVTTKSPAA